MKPIKIYPKAIEIISEYGCYHICLDDVREEDEILETASDDEIKQELVYWLPAIKTDWLPISDSLIKQIDEWDNVFQNSFINTKYEFDFAFKSKEQELWFYEEEKAIIKRLRIELPNTEIVERKQEEKEEVSEEEKKKVEIKLSEYGKKIIKFLLYWLIITIVIGLIQLC